MAKSGIDKILEGADKAPVPTLSPEAMASLALAEADKKTVELHQQLLVEEKVAVSLAPQYRPYFGNIMQVGLNGIVIYVPIDGRSHMVPKSYAPIIHQRRRAVDDFLLRKGRLSDVQNNFERSPGELKL